MALINSLLIRSGTGWTERTDAPSIALNTRFEAYLALGAIQTEDGVDTYADAQLDIFANPREEITAGIAPIGVTDTPYLDYEVGDVVTVPNSAGAPVTERVRAITVTENADTGIAVFTPTFKDFILERAEQIQIAIKKMSNGSLAGASQVAMPIRENFVPREVQTLDGSDATIPFIVVASDGSGDYLDPKLAIDATPTSTPTVIFVKNTGSTYTTAGVDISSKQIIMWGVSQKMRFPAAGATGPSWVFSSSANFTMNGSTVLHVVGMQIDSAASTLGMVAGSFVYLDQASLGGGGSTLAVGAGSTYAYQSEFAIHSTSFTGAVNAWDSAIHLPNSTMTLTTADLIWRGCALNPGGGSTHMTLAYAGGSSGAQLSITDCDCGEFAELILSGWNQATFKGNTNHSFISGGAQGSKLTTLTCTGCDRLVVDSTMWGTVLTVNATQRFDVGGIWGNRATSCTLAGSGVVNATFDGSDDLGNEPTTVVTVSGSNIVGSIYTNEGSTQGILVSGNRNTLMVGGTNVGTDLITISGNDNYITTAHAAADVNDTGTGNTVQSNP